MSNVFQLFPQTVVDSDLSPMTNRAMAVAEFLASNVKLAHAVKVLQGQLDAVEHLFANGTDTDSQTRLKRSVEQVREKLTFASSQLSLLIEALSRIHKSYSPSCEQAIYLDENEVY